MKKEAFGDWVPKKPSVSSRFPSVLLLLKSNQCLGLRLHVAQ